MVYAGPGIELQNTLRSYMLEAQSFFGLPPTSKFMCRQGQDGGIDHHGYMCVGDGAKEVLDVRRYVGPPSMDMAWMMCPHAIKCHKALDGLARTVLGELNDALTLPRCHEGTSLLEGDLLDPRNPIAGSWSSSVLTALHYAPPATGARADVASSSSNVLAPVHIDRGVFTIIYSETEGLEVRRDGGEGAGPWLHISNNTSSSSTSSSGGQGQLTVLLGSTLEHATAGAVRAVEHRVVGSQTRHSIVYRLRARPEAFLDPLAMAGRLSRVPLPGLLTPQGRCALSVGEFMQTFATRRVSINTDHGGHGSGGGGEGSGGDDGGGDDDDAEVEREEAENGMLAASQEQQQQHTSRGAASDGNQHVAGSPGPSDTINIILKDQTGEATHFKMKRTTQFGKVFDSYARRKGVARDLVRFLLDGYSLVSSLTPGDVDMYENDQIDVSISQCGD